MREKFNYLLKNTGYLFIGNFSSKILVFLLVPLYTSVLTTKEYGIYDLVFTTIQILVPILSLNIIDGVMRFTIDSTELERQYTFFTSIKCILLACVVFISGFLIVSCFFNVSIFNDYKMEVIIFFFSIIISQFCVQFARGLDDVKGISIAGILGTITLISSNILFLLVFKFGLKGYFWANSMSFIIQAMFLFCHCKAYKYFIKLSDFDETGRKYGLDMLAYCWPLVFNTLSWYINGAADRYTVTYFYGLDVNGIYSVAYKIPAILNALQTIFIQAWQLSAIKEYKAKDSDIFYKKTYQAIQGSMVVLCSLLILGTRLMARLLFANDFYNAWRYVPILLIYVIFNTLSGTIGGVFSAAKDSKAFSISAVIGATVNIILNIVLVYFWGAEGAAIATVISSVVIWYMRMRFAKKYVNLELNYTLYLIEYSLLLVQAISMTIIEEKYGYYIQALLMVVIIYINIKEFREVLGNADKRKA